MFLMPAIQQGDMQGGVKNLVEAANRFGGADNITAVAVAQAADGEAQLNG